MTTTYNKARAIEEATRILQEFAISTVPVPVEKIAKGLGAIVQYAPLDEELSGMAYVKDGKPIIGVNALHHPNRQRFTIAHEIAHLVLHRDYITEQVHVDKSFTMNRDSVSATGTDALEIEANAFAAQLLMPENLVRNALAAELELDDEPAISAVAKRFKVSAAAIQNRLIGLANKG